MAKRRGNQRLRPTRRLLLDQSFELPLYLKKLTITNVSFSHTLLTEAGECDVSLCVLCRERWRPILREFRSEQARTELRAPCRDADVSTL